MIEVLKHRCWNVVLPFIAERITNWINKIPAEGGETDFNYAQIGDEQAETAREYMVNTLGFFIPPSELFQNVRRAAPRDQNLNETLAAVFADIEASAIGSFSEDDLKGLFVVLIGRDVQTAKASIKA